MYDNPSEQCDRAFFLPGAENKYFIGRKIGEHAPQQEECGQNDRGYRLRIHRPALNEKLEVIEFR